MVEPVAAVAAAEAAAVEREHHPALPAGTVPGDRQCIDRAVGAAVGPLGRGLGHRSEDHVHHPQDGLGVAAHRPGPDRVEQRARSEHRLGRLEAAGVGRHIAEDVLEGHVAGRSRGDRGDVDRPGHGGAGAGEVHRHPLAADGEVQGHQDRLVGGAVVVEVVLRGVGAVGQRRDVGPHEPGRPGGEFAERRGDHVRTELVDHLVHAAHAEVQGIELRGEISVGVGGNPADAADQADHVGPQSARVAQLHRRYQHPLLGALGGRGVVVARNRAADVGVVPHRRHPAEQPAVAEVGAHQLHVVEMGAAPVRVVEDPGVAVAGPAGGCRRLDGQACRSGHGAREYGQPRRPLHQRGPRDGVVDAVGGVVGLRDDRIEGRAEQGCVHLVHQLLQPPLKHGQRHRVQPGPSGAAHRDRPQDCAAGPLVTGRIGGQR